MAETKKRSSSSRTGSSKASRTGASKRSRATKSKPASTRSSRSRSSRSGSNGSAGSRSSSGGGGNGIEAVRDTVEDKAKAAGQTVGKAASKAKLPLVAGGAALAGAAGGLALASRQAHRNGIGAALRGKPRLQVKSQDVARVAKEVGNFSAQVGALATEIQRNREEAGNGKHRSPIEVALHGLTSRR